jgi:hypothetical protein
VTPGDEVDLTEMDCKIFVDGASGRDELRAWIEAIVVGLLAERRVEVFVDDNDEAGQGSGFLFFGNVVEVYFAPSVDPDSRVGVVSGVLEGLWRRDLSAVAACDYEDRLPWRGYRERSKHTDRSEPR